MLYSLEGRKELSEIKDAKWIMILGCLCKNIKYCINLDRYSNDFECSFLYYQPWTAEFDRDNSVFL